MGSQLSFWPVQVVFIDCARLRDDSFLLIVFLISLREELLVSRSKCYLYYGCARVLYVMHGGTLVSA